MEPRQSTRPKSSTGLRRYGPVIAIVVVVAVVAAIAIVARKGSDDSSSSTATTVGSTASPAGVLSFEQAKAEGRVGDVDWGARCDTTRGTLAFPSFFAGQCYAPFSGDNGGATATGVTGDSIKVVLYLNPENDPVIDFITSAIKVDETNQQVADTLRGFNQLYGSFFETYGRKVDLQLFQGTGAATDEVAARADAVKIAEEMKPFAVMNGPLLTSAFADELSARKVLCIACTPGQSYSYYQERDPYVWAVGNNAEQGNTHVAEYVTKRLAGKDAQWAGDPTLQGKTRNFGIVYLATDQQSEKVEQEFEKALDDGGVKVAERVSYASPTDLQTSAPQLVAKLRAAGVTSVIFTGDPVAPGPLTAAATAQDFAPEWILTGSALVDTTAFARTYDQRQWAHAFGVSSLAARTDPKVSGTQFLYQCYFGTPPPASSGSPTIVPDLSLFYAVVQGTGPNLTPATYRDALFAADPTQRAITQPSLSYGNKGIWPQTDYLGIDDATEIWWDPAATGPDELGRQGSGMYQYVDGGRRYLPGQWPATTPKAFDPAGAVTIYTSPPAAEQVPAYPSPNHP